MSRYVALATAGLVGFMSLSYEMLWYRAFSFTTGGSPTVFGALLFAFLLGIAIGAVMVRPLFASNTRTRDSALLSRLGWLLAIANAAGFLVVPLLATLVHLTHWSVALALVVPATAAWGAALPVLAHYAVAPDRHSGAGISHIYLANIMGSCAGALLTGLVITDYIGIAGLTAALLALGEAHAVWLIALPPSVRRRRAGVVAVFVSTLALELATPSLFRSVYERLQYRKDWHEGIHFSHVVENRSGVITITPEREVFGGGVYDGMISTSIVDDRNLIVRAYALAAVHDSPREVLMIGLSTGAWAQVIAHIPSVEHLTVVEINPGYLQLIAQYPEVASLLRNPKVTIVIDDGRRWLARESDRKFDLIVANTTFYWRAHATNLLSREYLSLVRQHLRPGGIFAYNTTNSEDALKTALVTFPYGMRMLNFAVVSDAPFAWNGERLKEVLRQMRIDGSPVFDPRDPAQVANIERIASLGEDTTSTARCAVESREHAMGRLDRAAIVTDDNMVTEWRRAAIFRIFPSLAR